MSTSYGLVNVQCFHKSSAKANDSLGEPQQLYCIIPKCNIQTTTHAKCVIPACFSGFTIASSVVSFLFNEPKGSCRARLDRTPEGLGVAWSVSTQTTAGRDKICDIPGQT
jgi:hypothetical protein